MEPIVVHCSVCGGLNAININSLPLAVCRSYQSPHGEPTSEIAENPLIRPWHRTTDRGMIALQWAGRWL